MTTTSKTQGTRSTQRSSSTSDVPATPRAGTTYRTQKGDTLRSIAEKAFGDGARWREIADANSDLKSGTIKPGTALRIPRTVKTDSIERGTRSTSGGTRAPSATPAANPALSGELADRLRNADVRARTARAADEVPAPDVPAPLPEPEPEVKPLSKKRAKSVEGILKRAGFNPGKVDGKITRTSTEAVKKFQESVGLESTGQVDDKTLDKLRKVNDRMKKKKGTYGVGQAGKRVAEAEKRLRKLGYDTGKADGVYDKQTADAVKKFRADQKELDDRSNLLGKKSLESLRKESNALSHGPYRSRVKPSKERRAEDKRVTDAAAKEHDDGTKGLGVGDKGAAVKWAQKHLKAAGFDPKSSRGVFDERTEGALKAFQRRSKLPQTGRVDSRTWAKLRDATLEAKGAADPKQMIGERSSAVKKTEKLLKEMGYNTGKVDGTYSKQTEKAVDAFRRKQKMKKGDGVGEASLKKIRSAWKKSRGISASQLTRVMPGLSSSKARAYVGPLNRAMKEYGITNEKRREAFLAQLGHESVSLRYFEEIASGAAYEGRTDLGNTHPGDGVRYKGRGPIQLTGRANYRSAGKALGLPLEKKPWLAAKPSVGFRIAGWFWSTHGLNSLADQGNFNEITRRINGGYNGLEDRIARWNIAKRVIK